MHHIQPKREGGSDVIENLMVLCRNHHDEVEGTGDYERIKSKETVEAYNKILKVRGFEDRWMITRRGRMKGLCF